MIFEIHRSLLSVLPMREIPVCKSILVFVAILFVQGCGRPPQVVDDEKCFSAVDALWTAVTAKRIDLLEQSATELERLHSDGRLSPEGDLALREIINAARNEEWMKAAKSLKIFMQGQRKSPRTTSQNAKPMMDISRLD